MIFDLALWILGSILEMRARTMAYIAAGVTVVALLVWLKWWIVPDIVFAQTTTGIVAQDWPNGWVFILKENGKYTKHSLVVVSHATEWAAVRAYWPLALASALIGGGIAWFVGRRLVPNDHAAAVATESARLQKLLQAVEAEQSALQKQKRQATNYVQQAQQEKVAMQAEMQRAHEQSRTNQERATTAEGMLLRERDRHKAEITEKGATISYLKKRAKNQEVDNP